MPKKQLDELMVESYEDWDLNPPEIPARSALCRIRPLGIGTAETECLTSYLARLARAHYLSIRSLLMQYLIPLINLSRSEPSRPPINFYTLSK
jgi:TniQ